MSSEQSNEQRLAEVARAPIKVTRQPQPNFLRLDLLDVAVAEVYLHDEAVEPVAVLDNINVLPELAGNGIGKRMVQGVFRYCDAKGVSRVKADVMNETVLDIYGRLFGEQAVRFYEQRGGERVELPMNYCGS